MLLYARPMETGEQQVVADPAAWLTEESEQPDVVEASLTDGTKHILLLPAHVSPQKAVGILIGTQEPEEPPWPPGEWLETETACWIRRSAIVSLRIVTRARTATA
jgi:hypothetical protein